PQLRRRPLRRSRFKSRKASISARPHRRPGFRPRRAAGRAGKTILASEKPLNRTFFISAAESRITEPTAIRLIEGGGKLMNPRVRLVVPAALASLFAFTALPAAGATQPARLGLGNINHIVVIYEENHSFDNLYGSWERVNGLSHASAANTLQVNQGGTPNSCLMQNDVNLTSPPIHTDSQNTDTDAPDTPKISIPPLLL